MYKTIIRNIHNIFSFSFKLAIDVFNIVNTLSTIVVNPY
jgi:hypothetical protein